MSMQGDKYAREAMEQGSPVTRELVKLREENAELKRRLQAYERQLFRPLATTQFRSTLGLTPKQAKLVAVLYEAGGEWVPAVECYRQLWGDQALTDSALKTMAANARAKLRRREIILEGKPTHGYRIDPKTWFYLHHFVVSGSFIRSVA